MKICDFGEAKYIEDDDQAEDFDQMVKNRSSKRSLAKQSISDQFLKEMQDDGKDPFDAIFTDQ